MQLKHEKTQCPSSCSVAVLPGRRIVFRTHPLILGRDDEPLVLFGNQAAGAVGGLQHVDDQVVGQHVQLLHIVPGHVHRAR